MLKVHAPLAALLLLTLSGCGTAIPQDPEGTLEKVSGGTLRVGVSENAEWVQLPPTGDPRGIEPALVEEFADTLDAAIEWVPGAEHELADDLFHGELDMAIGGFGADTPWTKEAGITRPYTETTDERGKTVKHVMLVPLGENAFLLELDQFLLAQEVTL
ncbi:transporter substrate-binding domain-containing protein [Arthrobacter tecti]